MRVVFLLLLFFLCIFLFVFARRLKWIRFVCVALSLCRFVALWRSRLLWPRLILLDKIVLFLLCVSVRMCANAIGNKGSHNARLTYLNMPFDTPPPSPSRPSIVCRVVRALTYAQKCLVFFFWYIWYFCHCQRRANKLIYYYFTLCCRCCCCSLLDILHVQRVVCVIWLKLEFIAANACIEISSEACSASKNI